MKWTERMEGASMSQVALDDYDALVREVRGLLQTARNNVQTAQDAYHSAS